jgi:hypothetical protein
MTNKNNIEILDNNNNNEDKKDYKYELNLRKIENENVIENLDEINGNNDYSENSNNDSNSLVVIKSYESTDKGNNKLDLVQSFEKD